MTEERFHLIAKALADPRRYDLLKKISKAGDQLACESLRECMEVSAATISHHMKELEVAGLVDSKREGKFVTYTLRREVLESYLERLGKI